MIDIKELIEKNDMSSKEYMLSHCGRNKGRIEYRFYYYHLGLYTVYYMVNSLLSDICTERENEGEYMLTNEIRINSDGKCILITCTPKYIYIKHRNGKVNRVLYDRIKKMA